MRLPSRETLARAVKFGIVGTTGIPVNLGLLWLTSRFVFGGLADPWRRSLAGATGWAASVLTNFVLNDLWTWRDRPKGGARSWFARVGRYYISTSAAGLVQLGLLNALSEWFGVPDVLAQLAGIAAGTVLNFVLSDWWSFKNPGPGPRDSLRLTSKAIETPPRIKAFSCSRYRRARRGDQDV